MAARGNDLSGDEVSDLATLWQKAVQDYKRRTGVDILQEPARSMNDVVIKTKEKKTIFGVIRHDENDITSNVRDSFGKHLGAMQKCVDCVQMIGNAAAAFPPAMPVTIVFAACNRVLEAFAGVKADLDDLEGFLSLSGHFFERLSMIESTNCSSGPLGIAIVRVFSAQLAVYAIADETLNRKHIHIKKFFEALWNTRDPALTSALAMMQAAIDELESAIGYASYAAVKKTQNVAVHVDEKVDKINQDLRQFREQHNQSLAELAEGYSAVQTGVELVDENLAQVGADVKLVLDGTMTLKEEISETIRAEAAKASAEQAEANARLYKALERGEKRRSRPQALNGRDQDQPVLGEGEIGNKRMQALRRIEEYFDRNEEDFRNWSDARKENLTHRNQIADSHVQGTGSWLIKDTLFGEWAEGKCSLLWLRGPAGIGKSYLSYLTIQHLISRSDRDAIAYFYFRDDQPYLQSVQNAIACIALQISERYTAYAKYIAMALHDVQKPKNDEDNATVSSWQRLLLSVFPTTSPDTGVGPGVSEIENVALVFDGIDAIPPEQLKIFLRFIADLKSKASRVKVMVLSRAQEISLDPYQPIFIDITKEKIIHDMRLVVWSRLNGASSGRLKKFTLATKHSIRRKLLRRADGMLFIDHMIKRLVCIGREGAVMDELRKIPSDLADLYGYMVEDCASDRSPGHFAALKNVFAWLAFSKRPISLDEACSLPRSFVMVNDIDVEDELFGRCARLLRLSYHTSQYEENGRGDVTDGDNDSEDGASDVEEEANLYEYRNAPLQFQEQSLRQYFRTLHSGTLSESDLRTPARLANLTIFRTCIKVLLEAAVSNDEGMPTLSAYAANYWYEHFCDLDISAFMDEEIILVVECLYAILTNRNNVARIFDKQAVTSQLYPERKAVDAEPWYDVVIRWIVRAQELHNLELNSDIKLWAKSVLCSRSQAEILIPLAQGHLENWFSETEWRDIDTSYRNTEAAMTICDQLVGAPYDPLERAKFVSELCKPRRDDAQTRRAVGARAFWYCLGSPSFAGMNESRGDQIQVAAAELMTESANMLLDNTFEKAATLDILADMQMSLGESRKSIDLLDQAISVLHTVNGSKPDTFSAKINTRLQQLYWRKGIRCHLISSNLEALQALALARECCHKDAKLMKTESIAFVLNATLKALEAIGDMGNLVRAVRSWNDHERRVWLDQIFEFDEAQSSLRPIFRAASVTGNTDFVLTWLRGDSAQYPPQSYRCFIFQSSLAQFYQECQVDIPKAKIAMRAALSMRIKFESDLEEYQWRASKARIRATLASIAFEAFISSDNPECKEEAMNEMRDLPGSEGITEFQESHTNILTAHMLRIMGPRRQFQIYTLQIFDTCILGLQDSDQGNDKQSLRLLAKLLNLLQGLERDAQIAISAQFSIMNKDVFNKWYGLETWNNDNNTNDDPASKTVEVVLQQEPAAADQVAITVPLTETGVGEIAKDPEHLRDEVHSVVPAANTVSEGCEVLREDNVVKNASVNVLDQAQHSDEATKANPEEVDDDIAYEMVICDGSCGTFIRKWSASFYMCLICPSVDLCVDCYEMRTKAIKDESASSGASLCAASHRFIKGPVKGWRGIKDGVIRIDGEKPFTVKSWVKDLKETRWPEAWRSYWRDEARREDIGVAHSV